MNRLNIADNIVRLRHNKKITQEQLAEFIGVTKTSVSKWENRQSTPDITILPQLATFFDVTIELCRHIKANCTDMKIHGNAVVIQTLVYFQIGRIQEVVDELEEFSSYNRFGNQSRVLLSQAYAMLNNKEKAEGYAQISMYDNVMNLLANATCYLWMHSENLAICEETIERIEHVAEVYKISKLNPNSLLAFEYQAAICYLGHGDNQKALGHIKKYIQNLFNLFSTTDLRLHGDTYFDKIEDLFDKELDNGTNAPRNRKVVLEDAKKTLDVPPFTILNGNPEFEKLKSKLKELN